MSYECHAQSQTANCRHQIYNKCTGFNVMSCSTITWLFWYSHLPAIQADCFPANEKSAAGAILDFPKTWNACASAQKRHFLTSALGPAQVHPSADMRGKRDGSLLCCFHHHHAFNSLPLVRSCTWVASCTSQMRHFLASGNRAIFSVVTWHNPYT